MRLVDLDNTSIKFYITEELRNDPRYTPYWDRLDEGFFKPWQQHLKLIEAQLTADQIQQLFAAAEKEQTATGGNSTVLGKIVEKIVPDSMLQKLSDNLPEPDPNAANDPQFQQKATQAVNALPVDAQTKGGLMQIVKNAVTNPAVQPIVLSLVGSVIGGLMSKIGPAISVAFPGGGTIAAGVTGAVVAGAVAVAAAKIQGKSWKDAFKGAVKPALAGATGAVLGKLAGDFISSMGSGGGGSADGGSRAEMDAAVDSDRKMMGDLQKQYPPDQYEFSGQGERLTVVDKTTGEVVATQQFRAQTMDTQTFADLANNDAQTPNMNTQGGQGAVPAQDTQKFSGVTVANEPVIPGQPLSPQQMAVVDMSKSMGNTPSPEVQAAYDLAKQSAPAPSPEQAGQISPVWRNKTRMPQGVSDSREYIGQRLSEGQVYMIFNRVVTRNDRLLTEGWLVEGPMDWIKKTAKNLTTKVTADKLNKAWKAAGSPLDSEAVAKVLGDAGVNDDVVKKVYADLKIGAEAQPQAMTVDQVNDLLAKLPVDRKVRLVNYMKNQLKVA
jgi:hypothetical protein